MSDRTGPSRLNLRAQREGRRSGRGGGLPRDQVRLYNHRPSPATSFEQLLGNAFDGHSRAFIERPKDRCDAGRQKLAEADSIHSDDRHLGGDGYSSSPERLDGTECRHVVERYQCGGLATLLHDQFDCLSTQLGELSSGELRGGVAFVRRDNMDVIEAECRRCRFKAIRFRSATESRPIAVGDIGLCCDDQARRGARRPM